MVIPCCLWNVVVVLVGRGGFGSYDASDDPELVEYAKSIMAHRPPRDVQIRPPGSQKEKIDIARIIAKWDLDIMDRGWGQVRLLPYSTLLLLLKVYCWDIDRLLWTALKLYLSHTSMRKCVIILYIGNHIWTDIVSSIEL
ncbi:hypothetical protein KP509_1Z033800 [Ceratopteris richardii]|nr:hypothetical protein KP509_1Z033800 [Ceratopteris richardii]